MASYEPHTAWTVFITNTPSHVEKTYVVFCRHLQSKDVFEDNLRKTLDHFLERLKANKKDAVKKEKPYYDRRIKMVKLVKDLSAEQFSAACRKLKGFKVPLEQQLMEAAGLELMED